MEETLFEDLSELGLNGYEAAVYLALLSRSGLAPSELATRAKVPRQRIYDVLESLTGKGLCTSRDTSPKTYFGTDPTLAMESLMQQRTSALERERERIGRRVHSLVDNLAPIFLAGRSQNDPLNYIEVFNDPTRIATQAIDLARSARVRVNSCIKRPFILTQEQNWRFLREPLTRGVEYRALYERSALDDPELREWMTTFAEWGQQIRIADAVPLKIQAFDDDVVLLSMQDPVGGPPSFTAIAIRHAGTVAYLNLAFERLWDQSTPFGKGTQR